MKKNDTVIIKPEKQNKEKENILIPIIYLILGIILAFKNNQAVKILFYIIGSLVIVYGIKSFLVYYHNRDNIQIKNINLPIAIVSILIGLLLILLADALNISIRYILGFFLIYMGVSRMLTDYSLSSSGLSTTISNIVLIILGVFSIFVSNAILVIIGWVLMINAVILLVEYFKK